MLAIPGWGFSPDPSSLGRRLSTPSLPILSSHDYLDEVDVHVGWKQPHHKVLINRQL